MYTIIKEYNKISNKLKIKRKEHLWEWVNNAIKITTVLNKKNKYYKNSKKIKFLGVLLIVLLDDLAENLQDKKLLNLAIKIVKNEFYFFSKNEKINNLKNKNNFYKKYSLTTAEINYLNFIQTITKKMLTAVLSLPNYFFLKKYFYKYWGEVIKCFIFTLQTNNFIKNYSEPKIEKYFKNLKYSYYVNVSGHNMHIILAMLIDLMSLKKINKKEITMSIKAAKEAQAMGRIGNWVSTWKREMVEKDFSSGIIIYCINEKKINIKDIKKYLKKTDTKNFHRLVKQIEQSGSLNYFFKKWNEHRENIKKMTKKINFFSINKYLKGADNFLKMHLENMEKI